MDRKVLAIVGIIALHLALMLLFRGTLKPEELVQAAKTPHPDALPLQPNPYPAQKLVASEAAADGDAPKPEQLIATAAKSEPRAKTISRERASSDRASDPEPIKSFKTVPTRMIAVTPPVWQDTVIWVKRTEIQPIYRAERTALAEPKPPPVANIAPIKKKKSFIKKAGTVIRKPYDWIKTLVSKL